MLELFASDVLPRLAPLPARDPVAQHGRGVALIDLKHCMADNASLEQQAEGWSR